MALSPGFRIDQHDRADVGQLQFSRIDHLDGDHVMPRRKPAQRTLPGKGRRVAALGIEEVGDHDAKPRAMAL